MKLNFSTRLSFAAAFKREAFNKNLLLLIFTTAIFFALSFYKNVSAKNLEPISAELIYDNSNLNLANYSADQNMRIISVQGVTEVFSADQIGGYPWIEHESYGEFVNHYYISDPDNAKIVAEYSNVGTYKGKNIDCRVTISGFVNFYDSGFGVPSIQLPEKWQTGIWVYDINYLIYQYDFFYTGTSATEPINFQNSLWIYGNVTLGEKIVYLNNPEQTTYVYDSSKVYVDTTNYKGTVYSSINSSQPFASVEDWRQIMAVFPVSGTSQRFILDLATDEELSFPDYYIACLVTPSLAAIDYPYANFFTVSTSVTNGVITPSDDEVKERTSKTISYSPNSGYAIDSIVVDGNNVNISNYPNSYTFSNITSNHTIVVTYKRATANLSVTKAWQDQSNKFSLRPQSIILDAFAGSSTTSSGSCTATSANSYKCTISDLLAYDTNGNEITYTVKERNTPKAYTTTTPTVVIARTKTVTVTNTLVTKSISVKKTWNDGNNQDGIRPSSIRFDLYCGSTKCGDNPYTITSANNWTITIPNIPVYNTNGQAFTYSVVEEDF